MANWGVCTTFDVDPDEATMDAWQSVLDERGVDGTPPRCASSAQDWLRRSGRPAKVARAT